MKSIDIAIIDDESQNIDSLKEYLKLFNFDFKLIGTAATFKEGNELLQTQKIDLLFLDMKLPDGEGVELLKKFPDRIFHVIFFTAHLDYALAAFEQGSLDYLLKPIELEALSRVLKKITNQFLNKTNKNEIKSQKVAIPHNEGILYLELKEIVYLQAYGEYCYLITKEKKILISKTLKSIEAMLDNSIFIRIHRSYLVNKGNISFLKQKGKIVVEMNNGDVLEVSRRNKALVEKALAE